MAVAAVAFNAHLAAAILPPTCGDGNVDMGEQCDDGGTANGDCCDQFCQYESTSTICSPANGACDPADHCDGAGTCVTNFAPTTTLCRAAVDVCDTADNCDGVGACSADAKNPTTTVCRPAAGLCDEVENCDGSSDACPTDAVMPVETTCRASAGICDPDEICDGSSTACPADMREPTTTECRTTAGVCDPAEHCDGVSATCPADSKSPTTTVCRGSAGVCDVVENCDGVNDACPSDAVKPTTALCRLLQGKCDVVEYCDGASLDCPTDLYLDSSTLCRPETNVCDIEEYCTGSGPQCPTDLFKQNCGIQCYRSGVTIAHPNAGAKTVADVFNNSIAPDVKIKGPQDLCTPTSINNGQPLIPLRTEHMESYTDRVVRPSRRPMSAILPENVTVTNQYETLQLKMRWPFRVVLQTGKSPNSLPSTPITLDDFTCYRVQKAKGQPAYTPRTFNVTTDQFRTAPVTLLKPLRLCMPTDISGNNPDAITHIGHLLCYRLTRDGSFASPGRMFTSNDFGKGQLYIRFPKEMCIPSSVSFANPPPPPPEACTTDAQCFTGHCIDGYCCNTVCDDLCYACNTALTGATNGVCAPVSTLVGSDTTATQQCIATPPMGPPLMDGCASPNNCACDGAGACTIAGGGN